ncbi:hypothetical protein BUALT_Bualt14G0039300 [Buddleja alternifolia]|uniref:F-box domain-containing protein n=1 Tax=Buddleja alternifolia TaxID=168488 RepID=A0AAV6WRZ1_9LAMI|nr:hypothetical protein BUALT_Bualt14G0039300 [Buddleja alternifolia]
METPKNQIEVTQNFSDQKSESRHGDDQTLASTKPLTMETHKDLIEVTQKFADQKLLCSHGDNQTATTSYLPREIIQEILSRLLFKSIIRFQIVSKSWDAIISELRFSRVHLRPSKIASNCLVPHYHFLWQSYVSAQRRDELRMDYLDVAIYWKSLLPSDELQVVWESAFMAFSIEQRTGKNCFMLGSKRLTISSGKGFKHKWQTKFHPQSRFPKVAELVKYSKTLFIRGVLKIEMLSPDTFYAAYLVFRLTVKYEPTHSFIIKASGGEGREEQIAQIAVSRGDGWMEVEIGDFLVTKGDDRDIEAVVLLQMKRYKMRGLIVEDIRFSEVATLRSIGWIHIQGKIKTQLLSKNTTYAAYLVFWLGQMDGLKSSNTVIRFINDHAKDSTNNEHYESRATGKIAHKRGDGWMEIEMGKFYNGCGDDGEVEAWLIEVNSPHVKSGLVVEGIEFRPV